MKKEMTITTKIVLALSIMLLSAGAILGTLILLNNAGVIESAKKSSTIPNTANDNPITKAKTLEEQARAAVASNDYAAASNLYKQAADLYRDSNDIDSAANASANAEATKQSTNKSKEVPEEDQKSALPKS